ncbi:DNA-directed RNA polymerase subunit beta [Rossellomorea marisflavi]|uniref:DNA-directed RNA polymerase subunit beta n=1 Tax=Rossellomorea marisflavi TaxID=189381 RepID=UPI003511F57A
MSEKELLQEQPTEETKTAEEQAAPRWVRVRLFPIWLRILLFLVLFAGFLALGAVFGYAVIGDGKASDVFKAETWQHIADIVKKAK